MTSEQRPPVNSGHCFWVPRVVVVHKFDCILTHTTNTHTHSNYPQAYTHTPHTHIHIHHSLSHPPTHTRKHTLTIHTLTIHTRLALIHINTKNTTQHITHNTTQSFFWTVVFQENNSSSTLILSFPWTNFLSFLSGNDLVAKLPKAWWLSDKRWLNI